MDIFDDEDMSFLHDEANRVEDWPDGMQGLVDKGIVKVWYDKKDNAHFLLTKLGRRVCNEIDLRLN
jgi:hypothetical protein